MKTVNPYFLHTLLAPLTGLADDDEATERFRAFDSNDEAQVKGIIRELLTPHFRGLSGEIQERSRVALSYYLAKEGANLGRVFNSRLPPFDPPSDPRQFFVWLWQELFPTESFNLEEMKNLREVPDINEPNRLAAKAIGKGWPGSVQ